ncbi:MAG: hypothetical protein ACPG47_12165 [Leucothrix sp.]
MSRIVKEQKRANSAKRQAALLAVIKRINKKMGRGLFVMGMVY